MGKLRSLGRAMGYNAVDSTALLTVSNPIYTVLENAVSGMTDEASIKSRLTVAALSYLGMGFAWSRMRDVSRNVLNITQKTREGIQTVHDGIYSAGFNAVVTPLIYLANGVSDMPTLVKAVGSTSVACAVMGPLLGYAVDASRDLGGLHKCERALYPEVIRRQRPALKKGLAALLVAGSVGAMAAIYHATPDAPQPSSQSVSQGR